MNNLTVQIAIDFVECTKQQKDDFLERIKSLKWRPLNPNKLWEVDFGYIQNKIEVIKNIEQELILAKKLSSLYELDFVIIADEEIYFNQLI